MRRISTRSLSVILLTVLAALLWLMAREGGVNEDEGWILYAGRRLHEGARPYVDFPLFQAPLVPWLQGLWQGGEPRSLLVGRGLSAVCWWGATGLVWLAMGRGTHRWALVYALVVMGASPFVLRHAVLVKTYAPTALLLSAALCCLRPGRRWALGGGLLLGLAMASRVSVAPLGVIYLCLLPRGGAAVWGLAGLLLGSAPLWLALGGPAGLYQVVGVHWPTLPLSAWLISRGGWLYALLRVFPLAVAGVLLAGWSRRRGGTEPRGTSSLFCLWGLFSLCAVHLLPGELHADHLLVALPLAALVGGKALESSIRIGRLPGGAATWIGLALLQVGVGGWWVRGEVGRDAGSLGQLEALAQDLRQTWPMGSRVFTTHAELAVASGWVLPQGLEMGRYSLVNLSTEEAMQRGVLNEELALVRLEERWDGAAWTPGGGALTAALEARYLDRAFLQDYGQFRETLSLGRGELQ